MLPIAKFYITPNFNSGFTYTWLIDPTFHDPMPWSFIVEESNTLDGPFKAISPELSNVYSFKEEGPRLLSPDNNLFFRVKFKTASAIYYSSTISPHKQLDRESFLLVREIMRKEVLQQRNLTGILADIWIRSSFGPYCNCIDPITKDVITARCPGCFGVGRTPGYHGPYTTWCTFGEIQKAKGLQDDSTAPKQAFQTNGRLIAVPELKTQDIIVDTTTDRRFYVDSVQNLAEIRRVPIVQQVGLNLIPTSMAVYQIGAK